MIEVEQRKDSDGYFVPKWPEEVWRNNRIYFIRAGEFVKVGFSTDVERRLKELQASSPIKLTVSYVIVGTIALEREAHRRLRQYGKHVHGEWFRIDDDQVKWIVDDLWMDGLIA